MQTQPRPPLLEEESPAQVPVSEPAAKAQAVRWLNFGLALAGLGLGFVYVSRGWAVYDYLPGGRRLIFGLLALVGVGLAGWRVWIGPDRTGLTRLGRKVWTNQVLREAWPVVLIMGLALAVRLVGLQPDRVPPDGWNLGDRAIYIIQTGDYDPLSYHRPGLAEADRQPFAHPTLYVYMEVAVYALKFLQGVSANQYAGTAVLVDPPARVPFYLWGQVFTALLGVAAVGLVYWLGRQFYNRVVGLVAALFLGFFSLYIANSQVITNAVPGSLMALLPFLAFWPILQGRQERRFYLWAGLLTGLAVATSYTNLWLVVPLLLAHLLGRSLSGWVNWHLLIALVLMVVGFGLGAPFVFLHLPQFLNDLAGQLSRYNAASPASGPAWLEYARTLLSANLALAILGLLGVIVLAARHQRRDLLLLSFPLLVYLQLSSFRQTTSANLVPVVPFLALFAAFALVSGVEWAFRNFGFGIWDLGFGNGSAVRGQEPGSLIQNRKSPVPKWGKIENSVGSIQNPKSKIQNILLFVFALLVILFGVKGA